MDASTDVPTSTPSLKHDLSARQLCALRFVATGSPYPAHYSLAGWVTAFQVSEELHRHRFLSDQDVQGVGSLRRRKRVALNTLNALLRRGLVINGGPSGQDDDGHGYWRINAAGETLLQALDSTPV